MKLVRSLALFATAAVAGMTACHVYVDEEPARRPPPPPRYVVRPAPPPPEPEPAPLPPPPPPPQQREVRVVPMHLHGGAGGEPTATCLDGSGTAVGDCSSVSTPSACSAAPTPQAKCNAYKSNFIPKVAAIAVSCITGLTSAQLCDSTSVSTCARTALAQACPSPNVSQLCAIAATPCKTTAADCTSIVSGLSDQGQQSVAECVAQGCSTGLSACIDALALPKH